MLATDLPELRRLIAGNQIGLMIDSASPQAIAQAIDGVAAGPQLGRLRANVIEARRRLNWAEESKILVDIFRRLKPA